MKNIRIFFKNIYKYFIQSFFKILYGDISYKPQNEQDNEIVIKQVENKNLKKINKENYHVYKITNGQIYTDFVENVAVINKRKIINKASFQQIDGKLQETEFNSVLYKGTPNFQKKIKGNILCLTQGASGHKNYFHWLFDILPKIKIYSEVYSLNSLAFFYLSKLQPYQKKILEILGFGNIEIIDCNKYRHIAADQIFTVDHPWYTKGYISKEAKNLPIWVMKWIRNIFLDKATEFNCNEKIFIDRSESIHGHCQIKNNSEVTSFLNKNGFTTYKVGQLSLENQIYLFKNAKIIIGAHGAAFANLVFCNPGTKVIEIKPINHPNYVSQTISNFNNIELKYIETPEVKNNDMLGDIYLNIDELGKNL